MRPGAEPVEQELADGFTLGSPVAVGILRGLLDGADYEHVAVLHDGKRADMFVDEESACKGLPRNEAATSVYRCNTLTQRPETDPETLPAIYGPAVLFDVRVWR